MKYILRKIKLDVFLIVGNIIGNIIGLLKGKKYGNISDFNSITFDVRARIGDGVVVKPIIILFSKYIKEVLKLNIDIIVEVNDYNEFVFYDNLGIYYDCKKFGEEVDKHLIFKDYIKDWSKRLRKYLKNTKAARLNQTVKQKGSDKKKLYISYIAKHVIDNNSDVKIGSNLWLDNYLLDYFIDETGYKILSIIDCITGYFKLPDFKEYIQNNIDYFYNDFNNGLKNGILIFVGNKRVRNLSVNLRHDLIIQIGKNTKGKICVIDDKSNDVYNNLIKFNDYTSNIQILKNNFTLAKFKEIAKNFQLLIGGDGGGFNYIRTCSNSITIYTLGNHRIWHIFTGNKKYIKNSLGNKRIGNNITINGKKFGYIYKKSLKLPSSDYSVGEKYFDDFPIDCFITMLHKYL